MLKEFREFAVRGNVMDLAVAVIIGGAFGKIITSLVNDVLMPLIGLILGGLNFSGLFIALDGESYATLEAAKTADAAILTYGIFIQAIVDFVIVAFVIFILVRTMNRMKKPQPAAEPTAKDCPYCFSTVPIKATRCPNCTSQL
jgi:large conductance mechanosensitive channel